MGTSFSFVGNYESITDAENFSSILLPNELFFSKTYRCSVRNSVGTGHCYLTLPEEISVLPSTSTILITIGVPTIISVIIVIIVVVCVIRKIVTANNTKYFMNGHVR